MITTKPRRTITLPPKLKKSAFRRAGSPLERARAASKYLKAGKPIRVTTEAGEVMEFLSPTAEQFLRCALLAATRDTENQAGKTHGISR